MSSELQSGVRGRMGVKETKALPSEGHVSGQSNRPLTRPPHALDVEQVLRELNVDPNRGLEAGEAASRRTDYGPNELDEEKGIQPLKILVEQIFNAMTMVRFCPRS